MSRAFFFPKSRITWNVSTVLRQVFKEGDIFSVACSLLIIFPEYSVILNEAYINKVVAIQWAVPNQICWSDIHI